MQGIAFWLVWSGGFQPPVRKASVQGKQVCETDGHYSTVAIGDCYMNLWKMMNVK